MKTTLKQAASTGLVFGLVHIFLVLTGFNTMIGVLFSKIAGVRLAGTLPAPVFLVVYTLLVGMWAGSRAIRGQADGRVSRTLLNGLVSGVAAGLAALLLNLGMGWLLVNRVDFRNFLFMLSFDLIRVNLFNLSPFAGGLAALGLFSSGGLAAGLLKCLGQVGRVRAGADRLRTALGKTLNQVRGLRSGKYGLITQVILITILVVAIVVLPLQWGSYWNYVVGTVGLYVVLGLGLNIIVGLSGQLVLGYIAFFAIGAYTMALLNSPIPHNLMWGFWPSLLLGVVLAALAGVLLGLPLMRLRGDYLAIVTLGFGEIIRILLKSDVLTNLTGGPRGIQNISGPVLFGKPFNTDIDFLYLVVVSVLLAAFVYHRLYHSRTGRAWMAIREDETVAKATGVNTVKYKLLALAIGAAFAGLAGGIFASRNQFTGPEEHSLMASINVLCLIIVGGMGNIPGTILGAFALKGLPEILREFANYRLLAFGALLVAMMLSRPEGLIPSKRPWYKLPAAPAEGEECEEEGSSDE